MAEYQRIVSYLYKYTNGQKGENVGFVRVETRSDGLRLFFHVKDLRMMDERRLKAYFYFHEGEQKKGIYVDEFLCSRGYCEYKKTLPIEQVIQNRELHDLDGMIFYDQKGLLYGTCWDEREIVEGNIELPGMEKRQEEDVNQESQGQNAEIASEPLQEMEEIAETESETAQVQEEESGGEQKEEQVDVVQEPELQKEEIQESPVEEKEINQRAPEKPQVTQMEQMLRDYPPVPIRWDSNLVEAVKIQPEDISKFPIKNWRFAENGFLLQGHEIHKYLILGRIRLKPSRYVWVLGVPGIYNNREKYLASIFGFYDYIPMEQGRLKTGGMGFWITSLNC